MEQNRLKKRSARRARIEDISSTLTQSRYIYALALQNERSHMIADIRSHLPSLGNGKSKLVFGTLKVIAKTLVHLSSSGELPGAEELSPVVTGQTALLLSDSSPEEVETFFKKFSSPEYVRTGHIPTESNVLKAGSDIFHSLPGSMEPSLRQLGLSTRLHERKIHLAEDFIMSQKDVPLTREQCQLMVSNV